MPELFVLSCPDCGSYHRVADYATCLSVIERRRGRLARAWRRIWGPSLAERVVTEKLRVQRWNQAREEWARLNP